MYFLRGSLPWQGLKAATNKQKYEKIGEKKQLVPVSELCEGLPGMSILLRKRQLILIEYSLDEFGIYLNYVRKLGFEETPDYDFLRELFTKVLRNAGELEDGVWDWDLLNGGKGWQATTVSLRSLTTLSNGRLTCALYRNFRIPLLPQPLIAPELIAIPCIPL
jgi:casein kinase 1